MYTVLLAALALDLTLRDVLADLPHDAGAVVFVLLMGGFVLLTWYGSKPSTIERFRSTPDSFGDEEEASDVEIETSAADPRPGLKPPMRRRRLRSREKGDPSQMLE